VLQKEKRAVHARKWGKPSEKPPGQDGETGETRFSFSRMACL